MPPGCLRFEKYIRTQLKMIRDRVEYHRKRMSRRENREVSFEEAKDDYMRWLLEGNAKRFRKYFCTRCDKRGECGWEPED